MIVATTLSVLLLRRVNVVDTRSFTRYHFLLVKEHVFANFCKGFLRYILVKVVEPNPTGRFKRTFKLSKPDMDVVTGFMDTV